MYPDNFLGTELLVGLGLGRDPDWVDPLPGTDARTKRKRKPCLGDADVQTPMSMWTGTTMARPTRSTLTATATSCDTNVDGMNETTSANGFQITALKSVRLFEPTNKSVNEPTTTRAAPASGPARPPAWAMVALPAATWRPPGVRIRA